MVQRGRRAGAAGGGGPQHVQKVKSEDIDGIDASAGTRYSVVIVPDGRAYSTGYISDPNGNDYHGHLGIRPRG